jgi:hypothetical protein
MRSCLSFLFLCLLVPPACRQEKTSPAPKPQEKPAPTVIKVDQHFVQKALGPGMELANAPIIADIDPRPGTEALLATHKQGRYYQVSVARGDHRVLARAPLGGKMLANADIRGVGQFKAMDLWSDGKPIYLMPVETMALKQPACGIIAFRYRQDTLSIIGEFSCKCWSKKMGGSGRSDPFSYFTVSKATGEVQVEMQEERGKRRYRWDEAQQTFLPLSH